VGAIACLIPGLPMAIDRPSITFPEFSLEAIATPTNLPKTGTQWGNRPLAVVANTEGQTDGDRV